MVVCSRAGVVPKRRGVEDRCSKAYDIDDLYSRGAGILGENSLELSIRVVEGFLIVPATIPGEFV